MADQLRVKRNLALFKELLVSHDPFKGWKYIHSSSQDCYFFMTQTQKMLHEQIHGFPVVDPYHIAVRPIQLPGDNHRHQRCHMIDQLHIFHIRVKLVLAAAQKNDGIHALLMEAFQQFFFQLHIAQKIMKGYGIIFLSRRPFAGDKQGSVVGISDIRHQYADIAAPCVRKPFGKGVRPEVVFFH